MENLTQVSKSFSAADMLRCHWIGQALCAFSRQRAQETSVANDGGPLLYVYLCDGWSAKVRGDIKKECGQHVVKRQGHFRHEFLLERALIKCRRADGHEELHMLFGPPRGLRLGKSSWNALTAASEFFPLPRAAGHNGLSLSVYIQDGALFQASLRLMRARHSLYYDTLREMGEPSDPLEEARDLVIGIRCRAHGLRNSLPWGLGANLCEESVDNTHIMLASLLNCSSAIHEHVDIFLVHSVKFVVRQNSPEDIRAFWQLLEVSESLLDLFVELDPFWNGSQLEVSSQAEGDPKCMEKLSTLTIYCFRWLQWSTSRWCRAGRAGRFFLRSLAAGDDGVVKECLRDHECSNYLLNGYKRSSVEIRRMLAIVSFSSRCAEPLLLDLLKDDRMLMKADQMYEEMQQALRSITQTGDFV